MTEVAIPKELNYAPILTAPGGHGRETVEVQAFGPTSFTPGSQIQFKISSDKYIDLCGTYLKFTFNASCQKASAAGASTAKFKGASSFIERLEVQAGGQKVETIDNYNTLYHIFRKTQMSPQYLASVMQITQGTGQEDGSATGDYVNKDVAVTVTFPLSGILSPQETLLPVKWLYGGLNILITLAATPKVFQSANATDVVSYTISNPILVMDEVDPGPDYNARMGQQLQKGGIRLCNDTFLYQNSTLSGAGQLTISYNNTSALAIKSLYSVNIAQANVTGVDKDAYSFDYQNAMGVQFKVGSRTFPNMAMNTLPQIYSELMKSYNCLYKPMLTSGLTSAAYGTTSFVMGVTTETYAHDHDIKLSGIQNSNATQAVALSINTGTTSMTNYANHMWLHIDRIITILPGGLVEVTL